MPNERRYSNELNLESVGINLPYNMQAEQSVLGAVLLKPETLTDLVEIIRPEMFYTRPCRDGAQHLQCEGLRPDRAGKVSGAPADGGGKGHPAGCRR